MLLLCLAILIILAALAAKITYVPVKHRWRRRQARTMCAELQGQDAGQPPARIYARLRAMDPLAFEELLLESFAARGR